ncbi:MAG: glucokinase [Nitrospirales bacterium]|nr:glucokinase [Nitrospirales bacterium]
MILAGDIGGTKTLLALYDWKDQRVEPVRQESYWSEDYGSLEEVLTEFLEEESEGIPDVEISQEPTNSEESKTSPEPSSSPTLTGACFGVAGPVLNNVCRTTNIPWVIDGQKIAQHLQMKNVRLLNDLEATAYGLMELHPDELESLNPSASDQTSGTRALIAAGTGLGQAILFWDGTRYLVSPSEGGHSDFAPNSDTEIELLRYLRTSFLHVSYDRVLSGPGIHTIYQFLRDTQKNEPTWFAERLPTGDPAALIAEAALSGKPDICAQTLKLFISIYGGEAANLALKTLAIGGIYLGGGIAPKILPLLRDGTFLKAFLDKGRYKRLLNKIPVHVILNPKSALLGAASVAAGHKQAELF